MTGLWVLLAIAIASGQEAGAPRTPPVVVRMDVDLVQVDAVVTDGRGRHVTDLKAEDFEIVQDGKPYAVSHCDYVVAVAPAPAAATPSPSAPPAAAPPPSFTPLRSEDVRRVMAFVVDDYNLSAVGLHHVTRGLMKVAREERAPGDLVAILRTSGGMGVLHQFTNDPRILEAAVQDLRDRMPGMGMTEGAGLSRPRDGFFDAYFTEAAFLSIRQVLETLRPLPGRKSVVVFSERMLGPSTETLGGGETLQPEDARLAQSLREVTDMASRSSTVIYTVDPNGPPILGLGADRRIDFDFSAIGQHGLGEQWTQLLAEEREVSAELQSGADALARETGGLFLSMVNDVHKAVRDIQEDQKGYYVLGYVPHADTFTSAERAPAFRRLKVKVKRPGLRVRSRGGFDAVTDASYAAAVPEAQASLLRAMVSPFAAQALPIRLTPVFGHDPREGGVVRAYVHVDVAGVPFEEVEGKQQARLQLAAAVFGEKGRMLPPVERDVVLRVETGKLAAVKEVGVAVELRIPVPRPGSYQMRVALREAVSGHLGSATQFLAVPDLEKDRVAISGVVLGTVNARRPETHGFAVNAASRMSPAVRRFPPGADVSYGFAVYRARVDKDGKPRLTSHVRLVSGGREAFRSDLAAMQVMKSLGAEGPKAVPGFVVAGTFALPKDLAPGDYAVQIAVADEGREEGAPARAEQWTSLEVAVP